MSKCLYIAMVHKDSNRLKYKEKKVAKGRLARGVPLGHGGIFTRRRGEVSPEFFALGGTVGPQGQVGL